MPLDQIIVIVAGLLGIAFVYWFFLGKREGEAVAAAGAIDIVVSGGYSPEVISIPKGQTTVLNFVRQDDNSCLEEVVLGDFKIRKYLPLNQKVSIELKPEHAGEFTYSCGMNMYHGKIIVN